MENSMATPTTSVPGIGKATAFALSQHGFRSAEDLAVAEQEVLAAVPGFGESRAARVIESAQKLVGVPAGVPGAVPAEVTEAGEDVEAPAEEKKKKKKKKKDKKKGKKKADKSNKKKGHKASKKDRKKSGKK